MTRHAYIHALALSIKQAAQIARLRRVAERTAAAFQNARRCTELSPAQIEREMLRHLDAYRALDSDLPPEQS
jgi:hypothetical protein